MLAAAVVQLAREKMSQEYVREGIEVNFAR